MSQRSDTTSKKKEQPASVRLYLITYNALQTLGWSLLLYQVIWHYISSSDKPLYETVKYTVTIFQNAAILEVVHAAIRIVSSNPFLTFSQILSRVIVVTGVLLLTQASRETIGLPLALFAWSITEVIRYSNYTLSLVGYLPYFLKWLRYTTFIVLYPIGVTGELLCIYNAQLELKETGNLAIEMPNPLNFMFHYRYFLILSMFMYIPFFPQLYLHMFSLRRKVLGSTDLKKSC